MNFLYSAPDPDPRSRWDIIEDFVRATEKSKAVKTKIKESKIDTNIKELIELGKFKRSEDGLRLLMYCDWDMEKARAMIKFAGPNCENILLVAWDNAKIAKGK